MTCASPGFHHAASHGPLTLESIAANHLLLPSDLSNFLLHSFPIITQDLNSSKRWEVIRSRAQRVFLEC